MYNGSQYLVLIDTVTPITASRGNYANYRPVICGTSNGLSVEFESISFRNKCDGGWDRSVSGYGSWDFSVDGMAYAIKNTDKLLKANFQEVAELALDKRIFWAKTADINSTIIREGLVRIGSYKETADLESPYTFNVSFVGIGKPIFEATPEPPTPGTLIAYYGFMNEGDTLDTARILAGSQVAFTNLMSVTFPFAIPSFAIPWVALPDGQPIKTSVTDLSDDTSSTPIGSTGTFGAKQDIGSFDAYIGNFSTIYTGLGLRFNN